MEYLLLVILVLTIVLALVLMHRKVKLGKCNDQHFNVPYTIIRERNYNYACIVNSLSLLNKNAINELKLLSNIIEDRSKDTRDVVYILTTRIVHGRAELYLTLLQQVKSEKPLSLINEYHILKSIINTRLKSIRLKTITINTDNSITIPIPKKSSSMKNLLLSTSLLNIGEVLNSYNMQLSKLPNLYYGGNIHEHELAREVCLGKSIVDNRSSVCIPLSDLERHVLIIGSTGFGKTTTTARLVKELIKNNECNVLIFDWHNEYLGKLKTLGINNIKVYNLINKYLQIPLIPINDKEDIVSSIEVIEKVLGLTPPQIYALIKILERLLSSGEYLNEINLNKILDRIRADDYESRALLEAKMALYRKLYPLSNGVSRRLFKGILKYYDHMSLVKKITEKPITIIELGDIHNTRIRTLYVVALLKHILEGFRRIRRRYNLKIFVVIEEVENLFNVNEAMEILLSMLMESRKYGIHFILISHSIANLPIQVVENANVKIIHSVKSEKDLNYIRNSIKLEREILDLLPYLRPGEAIIASTSIDEPILCIITP